ncbi:MAG: 23S rRNA pseudouridine(1911/1915/1917) synthase RluD [Pseudomonadota bacterium]|nr:23S rRNA pseudouridine(1911/1915/1917) synthase RluD [Pseudomonadota bacterium]
MSEPVFEEIELMAVVPDNMIGERLDVAAAQLFDSYSRGALQGWIKEGKLLLDGKKEKPKIKVEPGQTLTLSAVLEADDRWLPEPMELDIVYEDDHVIVVNKPAGLVVHPGAGNSTATLINGLLHHAPEISALPRAGVVHRIDKETSGLLMVAKSLKAHKSLVEQLQEKTVFREYQALAVGGIKLDFTIDAPIARHPTQRVKMAIVDEGKPAVTHISIEKRYQHFTWIKAQLETGRTHQIRVHMAYQGYPLVGDSVYGKPYFPKGATPELRSALQQFKRQALHAFALGFVHPETQEFCSFEAPLPEDMQLIIQRFDEDPGEN